MRGKGNTPRPRDPSKREVRRCAACGAAFEGWAAADRRYCSFACSVEHRRSRREERFWSHFDKTAAPPPHYADHGPCWLWTGATCGKGYGACGFGLRHAMTHRLAWELTNGPIPAGLWVLHRCDVLRCGNPDHLFLGTLSDNMRDMVAKGRRDYARRLTPDIVRAIRDDWQRLPAEPSEYPRQQVLSERYGVAPMTVRDIVHRKTWKHVP